MQMVTEDNITELAVQRWGTAHDPRLAEVLTSLVRHLHDFAREVRLTEDEWMAAIQWLTRTGQMSDDKRQEFILASDVLGLSMLVVQLNHRFDDRATPRRCSAPSTSTAPPSSVTPGTWPSASRVTRSTSTAWCATSRASRCPDAVLDVWQADGDGAYEAQLERGRGQAARQVRQPGRRHLLRADHHAEGLHDPDGRHGRRPHRSHRHQPLPPGARALPCHGSGLRAPHHPSVRAGRPIPRQRRGLRDEGTARRPLRAARARRRRPTARRRGRGPARATTSCCSPRHEVARVPSLQDAVDTAAERSGFSGVVRVDRSGGTELCAAYGFADRAHEVLNTVETCSRPRVERRA